MVVHGLTLVPVYEPTHSIVCRRRKFWDSLPGSDNSMSRELFLDRLLVQNLFALALAILHDGGSPLEKIVDVRVSISSSGTKFDKVIEVTFMESTRLSVLERVCIVRSTMIGSLAHFEGREPGMGETQRAEDLVLDQTCIRNLGDICSSFTCDHVSNIGVL